MKLHVHHHTMVIYIQYKFDEIPFIGYLVMAEDGRLTDGRTDVKPIYIFRNTRMDPLGKSQSYPASIHRPISESPLKWHCTDGPTALFTKKNLDPPPLMKLSGSNKQELSDMQNVNDMRVCPRMTQTPLIHQDCS